MQKIIDFFTLALFVIRRKKKNRTVVAVTNEYTNTWSALRDKLEKSNTVEEWLYDVNGDNPRYYNIDGQFIKKIFHSNEFYRHILLQTFEDTYSQATSVAEFGCGVGLNLIYVHMHHPHVKLYGFELCKPGVELGNLAAKKFNLPIQYFQLNYLDWIPSDIPMPDIDVAFTSFSLEQIPDENLKALRNIMSHVNMGTFHLEPVVENYPWTLKGLIARLDHYKVGYLKNFGKNASMMVGKKNSVHTTLYTAHNPLMYPSVYVLKKETYTQKN